MIQRLTTNDKRPIWINTDHIVKMEVFPVQDGFPATQLSLTRGGTENVFESPDDIMKFVNRQA
jgi:hypothetical protein